MEILQSQLEENKEEMLFSKCIIEDEFCSDKFFRELNVTTTSAVVNILNRMQNQEIFSAELKYLFSFKSRNGKEVRFIMSFKFDIIDEPYKMILFNEMTIMIHDQNREDLSTYHEQKCYVLIEDSIYYENLESKFNRIVDQIVHGIINDIMINILKDIFIDFDIVSTYIDDISVSISVFDKLNIVIGGK